MKYKAVVSLAIYTFIAGIAFVLGSAFLIVAAAPKVSDKAKCAVSISDYEVETEVSLKSLSKYKVKECKLSLSYFDEFGNAVGEENRTIKGLSGKWRQGKREFSGAPAVAVASVISVKVNNTGDIVKGVLLLLLPMGAVGIWTAVIIKRVKAKKTEERSA